MASHKESDIVQISFAEMLEIRACKSDDWPAVWGVVEPVFLAGRTYAIPTDVTEAGAHDFWIEKPAVTFVAIEPEGRIDGTFFLKANRPGPGDHVANCGYIVDPDAREQSIASAMCRHSLREAADHGFQAMQYNFVLATNKAAIAVWRREGFEIVGTLPAAFRHPDDGYVYAYVMFRTLAG